MARPGRLSDGAATHFDLWDQYIRYRMELKLQLLRMIPPDMHGKVGGAPSPDFTDYRFEIRRDYGATAYRRSPKPLPEPGDWLSMAMMWKLVYNTREGKGPWSTSWSPWTSVTP